MTTPYTNIVLVGFMGTGKTRIGQDLANLKAKLPALSCYW